MTGVVLVSSDGQIPLGTEVVSAAKQFCNDVIAFSNDERAAYQALAWGADRAIVLPNVHSEDGIVQAIQQLDTLSWVVVSHALPFFNVTRLAKQLGWNLISGVIAVPRQTDHSLAAERRFGKQKQVLQLDSPAVLQMRPSAYMTYLPATMDFNVLMNPSPELIEVWRHITDDPPVQPERRTLTLSPNEAAQAIIEFIHQSGIMTDDLPPDVEVKSVSMVEHPPSLVNANVIVAGGKGMAYNPKPPPAEAKDLFTWCVQDGFDSLLKPIAELLGGTVAASRAIIDGAGIDSSWQVGQSGWLVKPSLYLAAGISGAVQHLQGIRHSDAIISINNDLEAPIFEIAHLGIVGDVYEVLPLLLERLRSQVHQD